VVGGGGVVIILMVVVLVVMTTSTVELEVEYPRPQPQCPKGSYHGDDEDIREVEGSGGGGLIDKCGQGPDEEEETKAPYYQDGFGLDGGLLGLGLGLVTNRMWLLLIE